METIESILEFWFGTQPDDAAVAKEKSALWWAKDAATDQRMRERFGPYLINAAEGELRDWQGTPSGRLALILLCDQFPRNIHRATAQSFAFDERARSLCIKGIDAGADEALRPIQRVFFYLPLEHSESLDDQNESVALFEALAGHAPAEVQKDFTRFADFAKRHRAIIERFGRFPHRNAILGRHSSAEEAAFLKEPGSSF